MKKTIITFLVSVAVASAMQAAPLSILDIKHSIKDDNVVPPESFETKTRELEENFFLKHFASRASESGERIISGSPEQYEQLLSQLPAEIELPYNSIVGNYIDMYLGKRRDLVADMLALNNYYSTIFVEELLRAKLPLELQYLPVIESALNPNAVSRAGAVGLWQLMPATATGLGLEVNSLVDQRRDPRLATRYAVRYLKQLYDIYGDWSLAIAAYNCGPGNVNKALRRAGGGKKDYWEIYSYLLPETRGYVPAFIAANYVMNYYDKHGIRPTLVKQKLVTDTVLVDKRVHFNQIAEVLNIPVEEIRMLNPQFRKDIIPGDNHPYALVLPSQQALSYIMSEKQILERDADSYARRTHVEPGKTTTVLDDGTTVTTRLVKKTHTVGRGENLRSIAKKYGVSATDIKRWNNMKSSKVKAGKKLVIETYEREPAEGARLTARTSEKTANEQKTDSSKTSPAQKTEKAVAKAEKPAAKATPAKATTSKVNEKQPAAPAKPTIASTYKVRKGDTLDKIARAHGTTVAALQAANGMTKNQTRINIDQILKIPAPAPKKQPQRKH